MHRFGYSVAVLIVVGLFAGCSSAPLPVDTNVASGDLRDQFRIAIIDGDIGEVNELLATQPLLAAAPHPTTGQPPIHVAAATGNAAIVRALLEAGADPYVMNDDGEAAVEIAQRSGASQELIELLR